MAKKSKKMYLLAIQLLSGGIEVIVFDCVGEIKGRAYNSIPQFYPEEGQVETDPNEIWRSTLNTVSEALSKSGIYYDEIGAIGIANQKNTIVVWDKKTGEPVGNAIDARCPRGKKIFEDLVKKRAEKEFKTRTGLNLSYEHSGIKLKWMLDHVNGLKKRALKGEVLFGNLDSWLLWKMTEGKAHLTDYTNASRTMLFNIKSLKWDKYILKKLGIPSAMLPQVRPSSFIFGHTERYGNLIEGIPIGGIAVLGQASLLGLGCIEKGMVRSSFGDGSTLIMRIGGRARIAKSGLQTALACSKDKAPVYSIEGNITSEGVGIEWVRDNLKLITSISETEEISERADGSRGVYVVPSFENGPNLYSKEAFNGAILGLNKNITKDHVVRAALESLSYQTRDIISLMIKEAGQNVSEIIADGSSSKNNFFMQFLSDILGIKVSRPVLTEVSALGAAFLAGLAVKYFKNLKDVKKLAAVDKVFASNITAKERKNLIKGWEKALKTVISY